MVDLSNPEVIHQICTYHAPTEEQRAKYIAIREAEEAFIKAIVANTPKCADQSAAVRHIREAAMTANAAVALDGLV